MQVTDYIQYLPDDIIREIVEYRDDIYWCNRAKTYIGKIRKSDPRKQLLDTIMKIQYSVGYHWGSNVQMSKLSNSDDNKQIYLAISKTVTNYQNDICYLIVKKTWKTDEVGRRIHIGYSRKLMKVEDCKVQIIQQHTEAY